MTGVMSSAALLAASASSAVRAARLMPGAGTPSNPAEVPLVLHSVYLVSVQAKSQTHLFQTKRTYGAKSKAAANAEVAASAVAEWFARHLT